jgi:hypothetical protein
MVIRNMYDVYLSDIENKIGQILIYLVIPTYILSDVTDIRFWEIKSIQIQCKANITKTSINIWVNNGRMNSRSVYSLS